MRWIRTVHVLHQRAVWKHTPNKHERRYENSQRAPPRRRSIELAKLDGLVRSHDWRVDPKFKFFRCLLAPGCKNKDMYPAFPSRVQPCLPCSKLEDFLASGYYLHRDEIHEFWPHWFVDAVPLSGPSVAQLDVGCDLALAFPMLLHFIQRKCRKVCRRAPCQIRSSQRASPVMTCGTLWHFNFRKWGKLTQIKQSPTSSDDGQAYMARPLKSRTNKPKLSLNCCVGIMESSVESSNLTVSDF